MDRTGRMIRVSTAVILCLYLAGARAVITDPQPAGLAQAQTAGALQLQGRHAQAVAEFRQALAQAEQGADRRWQLLLQGQLGGALLAAGQTDEAAQVLSSGLGSAQSLGDVGLQASLTNNLAHVLQAQGDTAAALSRFRECRVLAKQADIPDLLARSSLSAAAVLQETGAEAGEVQALLTQAWQASSGLPPSRDRAWLALRNAQILRELAEGSSNQSKLLYSAALRLQAAVETAEAMADARTASHAYGELGGLYENQQRLAEALSLTETAVFMAQQVHAPELRYRWEWQQGRIHAAQGNRRAALDDYRLAAATLQSIRAEFAAGNDTIAAGFREDASPLYLSLADLLLRQSEAEQDSARQQALLKEARETVELLKTTELQDYFQDDCVAEVRARIKDLDATILPGTAVLYPIVLPDRIELLLSLPGGLKKYSVAVPHDTLVDEVHLFRQRLEKRTTRQYLKQARQLYQWLIAPLEDELASHKIDTLVVVPGPALRAVPIAALHDGKDFLIRRYAIAMTPSLRLTDPRPIRRENISLLLNGLTESVQGFPPLVHVSSELDSIEGLYGGKVYRDQGYQKAVVQQELANEQYSIVHFATHGQFSGKVKDSFILTYDGKINMDDLEEFVGVSWFRKDNPVELLTLSACETAAGDDTAALGLASVAIKAGARSALASLWSINDQASSELVSIFYARLKDPEISKAQALKLAQVSFLDDLRYKHPSYWAPFLLIGNWL